MSGGAQPPPMRRREALATLGTAVGALAGCVEGRSETPRALSFSLPAFEEGVPRRYTCEGDDRGMSPPVSVERVPEPTEALALVVAMPNTVGSTVVHWLLWNLPADTERVPEGVPQRETVPSIGGARQGENDAGTLGYLGLCPPEGTEREFWFTLYALERPLDVPAGSGRDPVEEALGTATLASRRETVTYRRPE